MCCYVVASVFWAVAKALLGNVGLLQIAKSVEPMHPQIFVIPKYDFDPSFKVHL